MSHLAEKTSHRVLPLELEILISKYCARHTLTELSVVSRSWHQSTEPALYKIVRVIWDPHPRPRSDASVRVLWQLAQNPRRAALVQTLDVSYHRTHERWEDPWCERCEDIYLDRTGHCYATTAPYPTELLKGLIEQEPPGPNDEALNTDRVSSHVDPRIWTAAGRGIAACMSATGDNRIVFWSNFYLALRTCINLRAILFPVRDIQSVMTPYCVRLLADRKNSHIGILQVSPIALSLKDDPSVNIPREPVNLAPVLNRMARDSINGQVCVLVIDRGQTYKPEDLSFLKPFGRTDISVIVACTRRGRYSSIDIYPAIYRGSYSITMDAYLRDVGAYFEWRRDYEFKRNANWTAEVWVKFHPSQLQCGLGLLVQVLCKLGNSLTTLLIQATTDLQRHNNNISDIHEGGSLAPDVLARAVHPLKSLEYLAVQDGGRSSAFAFATEEFTHAVRVSDPSSQLEFEVLQRL